MVNTMVVFSLGYCAQCGTRFAAMPDPQVGGQWLVFERDKSLMQPTHISVDGLLCLRGHSIEVQMAEAAQIDDGRWLNLTVPDMQPVLN